MFLQFMIMQQEYLITHFENSQFVSLKFNVVPTKGILNKPYHGNEIDRVISYKVLVKYLIGIEIFD